MHNPKLENMQTVLLPTVYHAYKSRGLFYTAYMSLTTIPKHFQSNLHHKTTKITQKHDMDKL